MGLDAAVYCDCYESGRLLSPPRPEWRIKVMGDGSLDCPDDTLEVQMAFDLWLRDQACAHENGILLSHYIGNIDWVAWLRDRLSKTPTRFPMILSQVIHNGTHCGDFIPYPDVLRLRPELKELAATHCDDPGEDKVLREFESQLGELVEAASLVHKPIAF